VKVVSSAALPVIEGDLPKTLASFVSLLRDHCAFDAQTRCTLSLMTKAWKLPALVARALPPEAEEFGTIPGVHGRMTAAEFLVPALADAKVHLFKCNATLTDSLSRDQTLALLSTLAGALPVSGRGVHLSLWVDSAILSDASKAVRGRLELARPPKGKARYHSSVYCDFETDSKPGPATKKTLQELRDALGVEWRKPSYAKPDFFGPDRPSAPEMTVIEWCIQEAFSRAAADIDRARVSLAPHLYSQMGASYKRMGDIQSGIPEKIDFVPELRQFMRASFPEYASCTAGRSTPSFRKRLADHLDGLLFVERSGGFGKCFSLQYHVDFPGTRFAGRCIDPLNRSRSLFSLFHKGAMPPMWTYSTSEELAQALGGCRDLLRTALPALEARLTELLSPPPEALPQDIQTRGRLSAHEAYEQARSLAEAWTPDARFTGLHSGGLYLDRGYNLARGVGLDGRLQSHGCWLVRFESGRLNSDLLVEVPHSGQIRWNSMRKMFPILCALPSREWLDSPDAMQKGIDVIKALAPDHEWETWECGLGEERIVSATVWKVHASFVLGPRRQRFRDAYVYLDPVDGSVIRSAVHER